MRCMRLRKYADGHLTSRVRMSREDPDELVGLAARVTEGDVRAVARLLSAVEDERDGVEAALERVYRATGNAHVVGITGVPGAGKSTLVGCLAGELRRDGRKVAVLAVDPSSPLTGGAILGDRLRMSSLVADPGVYIRSMATRGAHGGLSDAALDAIDVLDAAGFDVVIVETVGVGQDDSGISAAVHSMVLVSVPGLGDTVQSIKAGLLETADLHVVNKSDRPDAHQVVNDILGMLSLVKSRRDDGWTVPVLATSAQTGAGIAEVVTTLGRHRAHLAASGEGARRRRLLTALRIRQAAERQFRRSLQRAIELGAIEELVEQVADRRLSPTAAGAALLGKTRV